MAIRIQIAEGAAETVVSFPALREKILAAARTAAENAPLTVTAEVEEGEYILKEPFRLSAAENPELKNVRVTLKAAPGAHPVVSARHPVKGPFEAVEGKPYYRCRLEKDENGRYPRFHDLYYKGKRMKLATSPTWINMEKLTKEERGQGGIDFTGIYMPLDFFAPIERRGLYCPIEIARQAAESGSECAEMRMYVQWEQFTLRVTGVDLTDTKEFDGKTYALVTFDENFVPFFVHGMHRANNMMGRLTYFQNDVAFLTEENTFAYDWKSGYLYFIVDEPKALTEGMLMRPALDSLFVFEEISGLTVEGLRFTGVSSSFVCDNGYYAQLFNLERRQNNLMGDRLRCAAIVGTAMRGVTVRGCEFYGIGCNGVQLCDRTVGASICDNRFADVAMSGITVGNSFGTWSDPQKNRNIRISIVNNYLEHIAYDYSNATAIYLGLCDGATVSHNTIEGCAYSGISAGCAYSDANFVLGERVNLRDVEISYNRVHNFMMTCRDGAAIYVTGGNSALDYAVRFNRVHHNYVTLDVLGNGDTIGYYFDGAASHWEVTDNIVDNLRLPLYTQYNIPCQYTHHFTIKGIYSTTEVSEKNHRPYHDVLMENCVVVSDMNELLAKYPVAKEIAESAGYRERV